MAIQDRRAQATAMDGGSAEIVGANFGDARAGASRDGFTAFLDSHTARWFQDQLV